MKINELFKAHYLKQCNKSQGLLQKDKDPQHDIELEKTIKKYNRNVVFLSKKEKLQKRIKAQFGHMDNVNMKGNKYESLNILNDPDFLKKIGNLRNNLLTSLDNDKEQKEIQSMLERHNLFDRSNENITRKVHKDMKLFRSHSTMNSLVQMRSNQAREKKVSAERSYDRNLDDLTKMCDWTGNNQY